MDEARAMNSEWIFQSGTQGVHVLFDTDMIQRAFSQDVDHLLDIVEERLDEVHEMVQHLLEQPTVHCGRDFISSLPSEMRHVMVLLYFEVIEGRLRKQENLLH
jgi:hypothetical protein